MQIFRPFSTENSHFRPFSSNIRGFSSKTLAFLKEINSCASNRCNVYRFYETVFSDKFSWNFWKLITPLLTTFFLWVWSHDRAKGWTVITLFFFAACQQLCLHKLRSFSLGHRIRHENITDIFSVRVFVQSRFLAYIFFGNNARDGYTRNYCSCYRRQEFLRAV